MLSVANYHQDATHASKSGLDLVNRAPLLYYDKFLSGSYEPTKEAYHYRLGTALHVATTQPGEFWKNYAIAPNLSRRTIDGREAWENFTAGLGNKVVLKAKPDLNSKDLAYDQVMGMRDSIMRHPIARKLLRFGDAEKLITWIDPITGVACKALLDFWNPDGWIIDLKSTKDASQEGFRRSIERYRYHVQGAFYTDGFTAATGRKPKGFILIAVEKTRPYITEVYVLAPSILEEASIIYTNNLRTLSECRETGVWPGYTDFKINKIENL